MKVWTEIDPTTGKSIRIFRNWKMAAIAMVNPSRGLAPLVMEHRDKSLAVEQIRRQVFKRDDYRCVKCGLMVVWDRGFSNSGEMDEVQARGKCVAGDDGHYHSGGVSVANCQTLCKRCHTGHGGKHDRAPSFSKTYGRSVTQIAQDAVDDALSFAEQYRVHRGKND